MSLERRTELKRDPDKIRAMERRAREKALARSREDGPARAPLTRQRKQRPPEGPLSRHDWEREVYRLCESRCIVTGRYVPNPRPINFHHVVAKQRLRRDGRFEVVYHPWNGVLVIDDVHANHETAHRRIRLGELPERCIRFAEEYGYTGYIARFYPAAGSSGD